MDHNNNDVHNMGYISTHSSHCKPPLFNMVNIITKYSQIYSSYPTLVKLNQHYSQ